MRPEVPFRSPATFAYPVTIDTVLVAYRSDAVIEHAVSVVGQLGGHCVVVDHGDGRAATLAAGAGATVIHDPSNPGFGAGQNRGLALTRSPLVLLCNPDAEIAPDAVREGARLLESRPEVAAVQGVIINRGTGQAERSFGVALRPVHLLGRAFGARALLRCRAVSLVARRSAVLRDHVERVPMAPVPVESLAATAVLVRRSAIDDVGGFDPRYFLYGEDLDLCDRLRRRGWELLALPGVWATHTSGGSADSSWRREATWWQGTMQFAASRWGRGAWAVALGSASIAWGRVALAHPTHARAAVELMLRSPIRRRAAHRPPPGGADQAGQATVGVSC